MSRREGDAQARRAAGDGWIPDGGNENAQLTQLRGGGNGCGFIADDERDDGAGRRCVKLVCTLPKFLHPCSAFRGLRNLNSCRCRGGGGGHGCGAEDEAAGPIHEQVNQRADAANVSAARAQRLAERAHLNFDAVAHAESFSKAASVCAIKSRGMRLVHHQPRAVFLLEGDYLA